MSSARKHFWSVVARSNGAGACPRKYGMNWFIPALVSSSPDSGGGISEDAGTRLWSRSSKKRRNVSRIRSPSMSAQSIGGPSPDPSVGNDQGNDQANDQANDQPGRRNVCRRPSARSV